MPIRSTLIYRGSGTFTVPDDWNPLDNIIMAVGAGGAAGGYIGGTGGCYAEIHNFSAAPGTVIPFSIGTDGGTTGASGTSNTWFKNTSTLCAAGASTNTLNCTGTRVYPGGAGFVGNGATGGGGGGAAGPNGAGKTASSFVGGNGDNNAGGAAGQPGTEWTDSSNDTVAGSGGGGNGAHDLVGPTAAGLFGGGAGAPNSKALPGIAAGGVLIISYSRASIGVLIASSAPDVVSGSAFAGWRATLAVAEPAYTAAGSGKVAWNARLAAVSGLDIASLRGNAVNRGVLAAIAQADVFNGHGTVSTIGVLSASGPPDILSIDVTGFHPGTLAATQPPDVFSGEALRASFGPLAVVVQVNDTFRGTAELGSQWPALYGAIAATQPADVMNCQVLSNSTGHLEYFGVGGSILYTAASGLERAIADVEVARMMSLPARLITENLDPWKVQSGTNLIYLAYGMGVTLWEDSWNEHTKREWLANQWLFKSKLGTSTAYEMALAPSGYDIIDSVIPPEGFFVSPDLTVEETNAWLRQMPQIRIKFQEKTGIEGLDEMFFSPDGAKDMRPGPDCSFFDDAALSFDYGRALYGRMAVLRTAEGKETPLEIWDRVDTTRTVETQTYEQISVPAYPFDAFFVNEDFLDDENYLSPDEGEGRIFSFIATTMENVTTSELSLTTLNPGLMPLSPRFEIDSDVEADSGPGAFANDWTFNVEYLIPDDGAKLLASRVYLLDPSVTSPMTLGMSFVNDARIGLPIDYAELAIDTHTLVPDCSFCSEDNFIGDSYFSPEDLTDFDRACRAVAAAKPLRDTILIGFGEL